MGTGLRMEKRQGPRNLIYNSGFFILKADFVSLAAGTSISDLRPTHTHTPVPCVYTKWPLERAAGHKFNPEDREPPGSFSSSSSHHPWVWGRQESQ